ncbi:hypothetical protein HY496_03655, partial [Candidatus Woesearchaeota archaeon]|nr:hypothetical protein [Candidatus Woesearchaeota archaeon]
FDPRCKRLLNTFKEGITAPIDVFYILERGKEGRHWFVDEALDNPNTIYLEPDIFSYDGVRLSAHPECSLEEVISVRKENLNPNNFALLVDDSWESGTTIQKTIAYIEETGYQKEKIFAFHYLGSGVHIRFRQFQSERFGFVYQNPVLLNAITMLDFFDHPERYQ